MARSPGLTPFTEDRPSVSGRNTGRVMVDASGPRAPRLRPSAAPVDTYVRPARPDNVSAPFEQLAAALGQLNPAIQRFAEVSQEAEQESLEGRVNRKLGSMSNADIVARLKDGSDPELTTVLRDAKGQQLFANRMAQQTAEEAFRKYSTLENRDTINIDEFIRNESKAVLDQYGANPHFATAFVNAITPSFNRLRSAQSQYLTEKTKNEQASGLFATFRNMAEKGLQDGVPVGDIVANIRREMQNNKLILNMPFQEQEAEVLRLADSYAEMGRHDLVEALLKGERKSPDGNHGSLLNDRNFTAKASDILQKSERMRDQNARKGAFDASMGFLDKAQEGTLNRDELIAWHKANPGAMTDSHVQSLITTAERVRQAKLEEATKLEREQQVRAQQYQQDREIEDSGVSAVVQGRLWSLQSRRIVNKKGEVEELDAEAVQKRAQEDWLRRSVSVARERNETEQDRFNRELPVIVENGMTHPEWKGVLGAGWASASVPTLTGEKVPEAFGKALALYKEIRAKAPNTLRNHVTGPAAEFYEAVRVGEEELGLDLQKAFVNALYIDRETGGHTSKTVKASIDEIRSSVRNFNSWRPEWLGGAPNVDNEEYVSGELQRRAEYFAKLGVGATRALELAGEALARTHININGYMIDASDRRIPPDFKTRIERRLQAYAKANGKAEMLDLDDLTVRPTGNGFGSWVIINKREGGAPVDQPGERLITLRDFQMELEAEAAAAKANVVTGQERTRNNLPNTPTATISPFDITGGQPESNQ